MNLTILLDVTAAALLLIETVRLMAQRMLRGDWKAKGKSWK